MTEPSRDVLLAQERAEYDVRYDDTDIQAPLREHIVPPVERALWNKYMGDLAGKTVLECGAGDGANAVWLAAQQAKVVAVELSPVGCERIRQRAAYHGLGERVQVYCGDCCRLETMLADH
jgi:protein-L-isoaspartate O-methyltransferase